MYKLGLEKAEGPEIKLPTSVGSLKKQECSRKTSISALLTTSKPLTVWIKINLKILQEMRIPDHLSCLLRNLYAGQEATVRNGHRTDWFQIREEPCQGWIWSPCLFNLYAEHIMRKHKLGWMKHKLESRFPGEISITSDIEITPPLWQKAKRNWRASWWKWKKSEKAGLKFNIQKTKIIASHPITSWQIDEEAMETVRDFILEGSKITVENSETDGNTRPPDLPLEKPICRSGSSS